MEEKSAFEESTLVTETETALIWEAKYFSDFILVRPVSPCLYHQIRKLDHVQFTKEFSEFLGNPTDVRNYLEHRDREDPLTIN